MVFAVRRSVLFASRRCYDPVLLSCQKTRMYSRISCPTSFEISSNTFGFNGISMYTVPTTQHNSPCRTSSTRSTGLTWLSPNCSSYISSLPNKTDAGNVYLEVFPSIMSYLFDIRLQHGKSQEVHVGELLCIVLCLSLGENEGSEGIVGGRGSFLRWKVILSANCQYYCVEKGRLLTRELVAGQRDVSPL